MVIGGECIMDARMLMVGVSLALLMVPAWGTGLSGSGSCQSRNDTEAYCINHGGCPRDGNCYFPDGSYCELVSFYNGTCPGREYYEQEAWMAEAYWFLNGDTLYYSPYTNNSSYNSSAS